MTILDQSRLKGKTRDRPIGQELAVALIKAGQAAGIDKICITSGGQPGSAGLTTGSSRHNKGRAADLYLVADNKPLTFSDTNAPAKVKKFITACAAYGLNGIGAGVHYMGPKVMHIGFGRTTSDHQKICWGADGKSANTPKWLRDVTHEGWYNPPAWVFQVDSDEPEDLPESSDDVLEDFIGDIPDRFNINLIKGAQESQKKWGIPASITLAQWALESGYGKSMPDGSNNPFGIKALAGQPSVTAWTTEVVNGKLVKVREPFRVYSSMGEAFIKHSELLGTGRRYAPARKFLNEPDRFADALTGVYATDLKYGSKLKSIMRTNDLYRFNLTTQFNSPAEKSDMEVSMSSPLTQGHPDTVQIKALQQHLTSLGYKLGKIDGKFGNLTSTAVLSFQSENGLPTTGIVDEVTKAALNTAQPRRLDYARETATEQDLAKAGSRIMVNANRSNVLSWITGAFGALGLGNSAIVNSTGTVAPTNAAANHPEQLLPLLTEVQSLSQATSAGDFTRIADLAKLMHTQLNGSALSPELAQLLAQIQSAIPSQLLTANPELAKILSTLAQPASAPPAQMQTIFDILPSLFASGGNLEAITHGIAALGSSVLPGFGGSLTMLGIGVAGRLLANRISAARLNDHKTAGNLNALQ